MSGTAPASGVTWALTAVRGSGRALGPPAAVTVRPAGQAAWGCPGVAAMETVTITNRKTPTSCRRPQLARPWSRRTSAGCMSPPVAVASHSSQAGGGGEGTEATPRLPRCSKGGGGRIQTQLPPAAPRMDRLLSYARAWAHAVPAAPECPSLQLHPCLLDHPAKPPSRAPLSAPCPQALAQRSRQQTPESPAWSRLHPWQLLALLGSRDKRPTDLPGLPGP